MSYILASLLYIAIGLCLGMLFVHFNEKHNDVKNNKTYNDNQAGIIWIISMFYPIFMFVFVLFICLMTIILIFAGVSFIIGYIFNCLSGDVHEFRR